jgi:hypothetical protein
LLKKTASAGAAALASLKTTEARPRDGFPRQIEDKSAIGLSLLNARSPGGNRYRKISCGDYALNRILIYRIFAEHFRRFRGN